jgi:O-antigen ligase
MVPLAMFAIAGLFMVLNSLRQKNISVTFKSNLALKVLMYCFLLIWLPMLLSLIGTDYPSVVLRTAGLYPLYGLMAVGVVLLLQQYVVLKQIMIVLSWVIGFWAFDGIVQVLLGFDLFNIPLEHGNVVFGHASSIFNHPNKYGFYIGMLASIPLFTLYLLNAKRTTHIFVGLLVLIAVLIGAARGGWVMFAWSLIPYIYLVFIKPAKYPLIPLVLIPILMLGLGFVVLQFSPGMQERMQRSQGFKTWDYQSINIASSDRLDIYFAAFNIGKAHPLSGAGVDTYTLEFKNYFPHQTDKSIWTEAQTMAHPHQVILELWSGAGLIGLIGFCGVWVVMWRLWRQATPEQRKFALPVLIPLVVLWWPINTHRGFYASELGSLSLFFLALSIIGLTQRTKNNL